MSVIALLSDTHFGARGDSVPLQNSMAKFFEKVFFPILREHDIRDVYHLGDFTDRRKYVNFATAAWVHKHYRQPMRDAGIHETVLVGNHDCFLRHSTSINSIAELYRDDDTVTVIDKPTVGSFPDGSEVLQLPWICDENRDLSLKMIADSKAAIVLAHLELAGFSMYRGVQNTEGMDAQLFDKFSLVLSGHYHHRSRQGPVQYVGAMAPLTWQDYNDARGFSLFDTARKELTFFANPYSLFIRLAYDDHGQKHSYVSQLCQSIMAEDSPYRDSYVKVVIKSCEQPYWKELVLDSLYKINPVDVMIVDDITVNESGDEMSTVDLASIDTLTLMQEYVDSLSINADKDALNKYLRSLYSEAISANQSGRLA